MKSEGFYLFSSQLKPNAFLAAPVGFRVDREQNLYDYIRLIRGEFADIQLPVKFTQKEGGKLFDVLDTGYPSLYLVSENFKSFLIDNEFTGWKLYDIDLVDKNNNHVGQYYGFSITGRVDRLEPDLNIYESKSIVKNGPVSKYYIGLYFEVNEWDGSDFFLAGNSNSIIVSNQVVRAIKLAKLTNVDLELLDTLENPEYALKNYTK